MRGKGNGVKVAMLACVFLFCVSGGLGGFSGSPAPAHAASSSSSKYTADKPFILRIGFENSPTDSSVSCGFKWSKMLAEKSDGRIKLEVFPSNELGNASEMFQAVREGTLDMVSLIPMTLGNFNAKVELAVLPGLFKDLGQASALDRGGFIGEAVDGYYAEMGVVRVVKGEPNFYNFMTTEKAGPILSVEEMKGKKLRISNSPALKYFFEKGGAVPTPIAWGEIYTSLQRNVIDGTISNLVWGVTAKFPEVAKVVSLVPLNYHSSDWLMNARTWERIPEDLRQIIQDSIPEIQATMQESWDATVEKNIADLKAIGVQFIEPTDEQVQAFRRGCFDIWKSYAVGVWGQEMVDRLENEVINAE